MKILMLRGRFGYVLNSSYTNFQNDFTNFKSYFLNFFNRKKKSFKVSGVKSKGWSTLKVNAHLNFHW